MGWVVRWLRGEHVRDTHHPLVPPIVSQIGHPLAQSRSPIFKLFQCHCWHSTGTGRGSMAEGVLTTPPSGPPRYPQHVPIPSQR